MHALRLPVTLGVLLALAFAPPAPAEVRQSSPDALLLEWSYKLAAPPGTVYEALGRIEQWWSDPHTYSGKAANLSLRLEPGGCWCERWAEGGVEHGRVVLALKDRTIRLDGAVGPLQAKAVTGVLTFTLKPEEPGTALAVTYRVHGVAGSDLDKDGPAVDRVFTEQFSRFVRLVETGKAVP